MAEFLLLNIEHVWDSVDLATLVSVHGSEIYDTYNMRIQKGDIIEVRPDGYWTGQNALPFNEKNCVVSVPFVNYEQAQLYMTEQYDENLKIIKKRKYSIDISLLNFDENRIAVIKNVGELNNFLKDKTIG